MVYKVLVGTVRGKFIMKNFKEAVIKHLATKNISELRIVLGSAYATDIVSLITEITDDNKVLVYRTLNEKKAEEVFDLLTSVQQKKLTLALATGGEITKKETKRSEVLVAGSIFSIIKVRLPFLILAMAGGLLAALIIDDFEEVLEAVVIVAAFVPIIMDMGGSVGTQSSTVFVRGVILGHININKFFQHVTKEVFAGLIMSIIVGGITGIVAALWQDSMNLGIAVGVALAATMTIATFLGYLIPFILMKLNFDQAAGTDPIITTIKDITGLMIFFVLVSLFMSSEIEAAEYLVEQMEYIEEYLYNGNIEGAIEFLQTLR